MKSNKSWRVRRARRPTLEPRPREVDPAHTTEDEVLRMLTGDFYFHRRIQRSFLQAGFEVEHLERGKGYGIWLGVIKTGKAELSRDYRVASRELRMLLNRSGFRIKAAELEVYERRKETASFSFILPFGCIGVMTE